MSRTVIDIDNQALERAAAVLGTKTKVDTVNAALRDIAGRQARVSAMEQLIDADDDLGNHDVMAKAWRRDSSGR